MEKKTDLSKYIVNVQGKDYITFPGLLAEAHSQGLTGVETELVTPLDLASPIVKATVTLGDKKFTGYGDANANNVAKKVAGALIRMAETRAVARALRFACNIDMTALEEIGVSDEEVDTTPRTSFKKPATVVTQNAVGPTEPSPSLNGSGTIEIPPTTTEAPPPAKRTFAKRTAKTEPNFP